MQITEERRCNMPRAIEREDRNNVPRAPKEVITRNEQPATDDLTTDPTKFYGYRCNLGEQCRGIRRESVSISSWLHTGCTRVHLVYERVQLTAHLRSRGWNARQLEGVHLFSHTRTHALSILARYSSRRYRHTWRITRNARLAKPHWRRRNVSLF